MVYFKRPPLIREPLTEKATIQRYLRWPTIYVQITGSLPFTFQLGNLISFSNWSIPRILILLLLQLAFNIP
jgi:hypothetical protein